MPDEDDFEDEGLADGIAKGYRHRGRRKQSLGGDAMKRILMAVIFLAAFQSFSNAGVLKVTTYPVRHFEKTVKTVARVATYPVRHPVKTVF